MTTDDVEKYFGNAEKVAEFFGITSEAVYQWRNRQALNPQRQGGGGSIPHGREAGFPSGLYQKSTQSKLSSNYKPNVQRGRYEPGTIH
jgi:hypothetical protein